jgi:hypothetical protein
MTEPTQTEHKHRSHSHSRKKVSGNNIHPGYFEPVYYFSAAILLLVVAKLIHTSLLSTALGALGIIIIAVSRLRKYKTGFFLSMVCILAMVMAYVWHWADRYSIAVFSAEVSANTAIFVSGFAESLIVTMMMWDYHRILYGIYKHMGQTWVVKRPYIIFFKLLYYFVLFLSLFWIFSFIVHKALPISHLGPQDSAMIAGALALLVTGIPAILFLSKGSNDGQKRHRHRQHHRHSSDPERKNSDIG